MTGVNVDLTVRVRKGDTHVLHGQSGRGPSGLLGLWPDFLARIDDELASVRQTQESLFVKRHVAPEDGVLVVRFRSQPWGRAW